MNVKRRHWFVPLCYFINFFICYLLKFRKRIILLEILKRRKCVWMEYGSEWAYNDFDAWVFRKHAFQAQHQYHYFLSEKSIHTLENKVLMHQCANKRKGYQNKKPLPSLPKREGLTNSLSFLLLKFNVQNFKVKIAGWYFLRLFAQLRISAWFS